MQRGVLKWYYLQGKYWINASFRALFRSLISRFPEESKVIIYRSDRLNKQVFNCTKMRDAVGMTDTNSGLSGSAGIKNFNLRRQKSRFVLKYNSLHKSCYLTSRDTRKMHYTFRKHTIQSKETGCERIKHE